LILLSLLLKQVLNKDIMARKRNRSEEELPTTEWVFVNCYNKVLEICKNIYPFCKPAIDLFGVYLVWLAVFYICSHLHTMLCVPATIIGFIMTPFLVPSPHCQALRWVIHTGGTTIMSSWLLLGTWCVSYILPRKSD